MKKTILFVCTGNYYRSRFAEEYFNHLVVKHNLHWKATSKGLSEKMPSLNNPGPISVHTLKALKERGIEGEGIKRYPQPILKSDFLENNRIIVMSELEHRPMLERRYPEYCDNVEFLEVADIPLELPKSAIPKIAKGVDKVINELVAKNKTADTLQ